MSRVAEYFCGGLLLCLLGSSTLVVVGCDLSNKSDRSNKIRQIERGFEHVKTHAQEIKDQAEPRGISAKQVIHLSGI